LPAYTQVECEEITMLRLRSLLILGCSILFVSLALTQSAAQQPANSHALPTLARIILRCDYTVLCERIGGVDEAYTELSRRGVLPRVNTTYDQMVVDQAKTEIQGWWRQRGVDIQVRADLTPVVNASKLALEFVVYKQGLSDQVHPDGTLFQPVQYSLPQYPKEAIRRHIQGDVRMDVRVSRTDGLAKVDSVRILSGDPVFAYAIAQAISKWTFLEVPQREQGRISLVFPVTIHFTLGPRPFVAEG
jgi:TonB family protein